MRKVLFHICLILFVVLGYGRQASAQTVAIDDTTFPDPGFREYIRSAYDTNQDQILSDEEIAHATEMNVYFCAEPDQTVCLVRTEGGFSGESLTFSRKIIEFPCSQISWHPLSEAALETDGSMNQRVLAYPQSYACYITGRYWWKCVIAQPLTSLQGIEYLSDLRSIILGGNIPESMEISNLPLVKRLNLAGTDSTLKNVTVKNCPKLKKFYYQESENLSMVDLKGVASGLEKIARENYYEPATGGGIWGTPKKVDKISVGKAPNLRSVSVEDSFEIDFRSLKRLRSLGIEINDPSMVIDLRNCKRLESLYFGSYPEKAVCKKIILPNASMKLGNFTPDFLTLKELDLRYMKNGDVVTDVLESVLVEARSSKKDYKNQEVVKTVTVSKKVYKSHRRILRKIKKYSVKVVKK